MAHDIFISYSHIDKSAADAVCAYMEKNGLRCWYAPRDIEPGADWADSIIKAIRSSRIFVLIFTRSSNFSAQVMREINNAVSSGATIIPLRLEREEPSKGMRYYLSAVHWLDAYDLKLDAAIEELYKLCRSVLSSGPAELKLSDGRLPAAEGGKKSKAKLIPAIGIPALVLIIAAVCAFIFFIPRAGKDEQGPGSSAVSDFSASNGLLACDGEWYYYRSNTQKRLFRMRPDGSEVTPLTETGIDEFCLYDGYIYYTSVDSMNVLCRMKLDGSEKEEDIYYNINLNFMIADGRLYTYSSYEGLTSVKLDGTDERQENTLTGIYQYTVDSAYMYFIYYDDHTPDSGVYRARLDGTGTELLVKDASSGLTQKDGVIYFTTLENPGVYTYDTRTHELDKLFNGFYSSVCAVDKGIVAYSYSESGYVFYDPKSNTQTMFLGESSNESQAAGDKLLYERFGSGYYIINTDGTGNTLLN